jgi:hypothetical protein
LTTDLRAAADGAVVDLGAGDGRFTRVLAAEGVRAIRLDRRREAGETQLVGDVWRPPLRPGSCAVLTAANLLRHLWNRDLNALLDSWLACLHPGGSLWILEDAPASSGPAARNFSDLQDWLARLMPGRGGLRPLAEFRAVAAARPDAACWSFGEAVNRQPDPDPQRVLAMLRGSGPRPEPQAAELMRRIAAEGLSYGDFWWARCVPGRTS